MLYRLASKLVVPSRGLARELIAAYPFVENKIRIVPNAADYQRLSGMPEDFDREAFRAHEGFLPDDVVIIFIALGQFERKGFPQLLEAMALVEKPHVKLLVVGGSSHWMVEYGSRAERLGIRDRVTFVGMQADVAPFLWASDVFSLPSLYEVFPLVVIEAAAAGRAILVTRLNGVEEYLIDGENAIFIERTPSSIAAGIEHLVAIQSEGRRRLGFAARTFASTPRRLSRHGGIKFFRNMFAAIQASFVSPTRRLNMRRFSERQKRSLIAVAGISYTLSLHKYFSRDALSAQLGFQGPLEFGLISIAFICCFSGYWRWKPATKSFTGAPMLWGLRNYRAGVFLAIVQSRSQLRQGYTALRGIGNWIFGQPDRAVDPPFFRPSIGPIQSIPGGRPCSRLRISVSLSIVERG